MKAYFVKYDNRNVLVKMTAPGALNAGGATAFLYKDGVWKENSNLAAKIMFDGFDYDEITEAEAVKVMKEIDKR